jgi:hypothetical protein
LLELVSESCSNKFRIDLCHGMQMTNKQIECRERYPRSCEVGYIYNVFQEHRGEVLYLLVTNR